jgi:hypothetical protein
MANVFTNLAADIFVARDKVGRELVGAIPASTINADGTTRAAKGDTIRAAYTRAQTVNTSYAPSMTIPEGTDQTVDNQTMSLSSYASIQIPYTGEDEKHLDNGPGFQTVYGDQILQAFRAISNKIELDGMLAANLGAGAAYGTSGTTPFASNLADLPNVRKILVDHGCPDDGQLSAVYNTVAGVNLRNLSNLYKVNEAGSSELLRQGVLLDLYGLKIRESAQVNAHTAGSGTSYVMNDAGGFAVGRTSIPLDVGSGTVLAGDVVTFAGDTNQYVVVTGIASAGTIVIASPGLRQTHADEDAMTITASYTGNVTFHKSALELGMRPIALPHGGDAAVDRMTVQDPWSGMIFELAHYRGYQKAMIEVGCLYGWKAWKPDFIVAHKG